MEDIGTVVLPHILIFPAPIQGPINSTFSLAELLCTTGFHITVLLTEDIHSRLQSHGNIQSQFNRYPNFRVRTISDGLPKDHPRSYDTFLELYRSLHTNTRVYFKEMLTSGSFQEESNNRRPPPVSCIIADTLYKFTCDVAMEIGIPFFYLRTFSACCIWTFCCLPKLIQAGEIPYKREDEDALVKCVPGTESFLRRRDLPGFCRYVNLDDPTLEVLMVEGEENPRANGLIINTFEELEGPMLSQIRALCPNLYPIGPFHAYLKTKLAAESEKPSAPSINSNIFYDEDSSCIKWLDSQSPKSVIYVSFGSHAMITKDQLLEIWYGLINSGKRFLWVIRLESVAGKDWKNEIPAELLEATEERGCIVGWAPQKEVLAHPALGAFFTHSGWNSTLECICEGLPMICWPFQGDQQINSRFVEVVWKLGLDMKDTCDRGTIEKMIKDVMDDRSDEFRKSADDMAELARNSLMEGSSSYRAFNRLVDDIKSMSLANQ